MKGLVKVIADGNVVLMTKEESMYSEEVGHEIPVLVVDIATRKPLSGALIAAMMKSRIDGILDRCRKKDIWYVIVDPTCYKIREYSEAFITLGVYKRVLNGQRGVAL